MISYNDNKFNIDANITEFLLFIHITSTIKGSNNYIASNSYLE